MDNSLQLVQRDIDTVCKYLIELEINSVDDQKNAEDLLIMSRNAIKQAEALQADMLSPVKESEKRIRDLFAPYLNKVKMAEGRVKQLLLTWNTKRTTEASLALIEAQKRQTEAISEAKETGEIIEYSPVDVPTVAKTSHTHMGSVTYRDDWKFTVTSPDHVPRDLCSPDEKLIRARIKSGIREIPGVLIEAIKIPIARRG
jgi:hypothetical protein